MKYYTDDNDRTFVEKEGLIYRLYSDGKTVKSSQIFIDCMWHELTKNEAIETAKMYEQQFV